MTLNVNTVEFIETIVPVMQLMDRMHPVKISEIEHLRKDYSSRNPTPPEMAIAGSYEMYLWTCSTCGYEWQVPGRNRFQGNRTGCPACAHKAPSINNNLTVTHPELVKEYSSRNPLAAAQIIAGTRKKLWWKCQTCSYEWEATGHNRAGKKKSGCPVCGGRIASETHNLTVLYPELAREYSSRNPLPVKAVRPGTSKKLWWVCSKGHEWQATGAHRTTHGHGCPACSGRVPTPTRNLAVLYPDLAKEYSSKNSLPADLISAGTDKKLWWVCSKGHEWQASGANRTQGSGCPVCKLQRGLGRPKVAAT